jgi:hypothetical protein
MVVMGMLLLLRLLLMMMEVSRTGISARLLLLLEWDEQARADAEWKEERPADSKGEGACTSEEADVVAVDARSRAKKLEETSGYKNTEGKLAMESFNSPTIAIAITITTTSVSGFPFSVLVARA